MTVNIARCPEHGLHGERAECFICGGPVEQVPMVDAREIVAMLHGEMPEKFVEWGALAWREATDLIEQRFCLKREATGAAVVDEPDDDYDDPRYINPRDQTEGQNG